MVTSAAVTFEAVQLARENYRRLKPLAQRVNVDADVLVQIGQLGGGKHPASRLLDLARNQLGFHWDGAVIGQAVSEYSKNESVIWLEFDEHHHPLHRLAHEALMYALVQSSGETVTDTAALERLIEKQLMTIFDAMKIITAFFVASVYGFFEMRRDAIRRVARE